MEYQQNNAGRLPRLPRIDAKNIGQDLERERSSFSSEMEVAKFSAPPNIEVRFVSYNKEVVKPRAGRNRVLINS